MKTINLKSIVEIFEENNKQKLSLALMNYIGSDIKEVDLKSISSLISNLMHYDTTLSLKDLSSFFISYRIPQIGKEFDLLRISEQAILNIECKSQNTDKIQKQLVQNKYYLSFLNLNLALFSYIEDDNILYKLNSKDELIQTEFKELIQILKKQSETYNFYEDNLNLKFNPSNYLISPFSKTDEFINEQYFLTQRQEEIERDVYNSINSGIKYFIISGEAGSGKTLLTYHIANKYKTMCKKVGLIHCGILNNGHKNLIEKYKWSITPIKYWKDLFNTTIPDIVIIDEFQRINTKQFQDIVNNYIKPYNIILILSGDGNQTFTANEGEIFNLFENTKIESLKKYRLNTKIRTNEKLANFIRIMISLDKKATLPVEKDNINITYFKTIEEANSYIKTKQQYSYISYTPSLYYRNKYADSAILNPNKIGNAHEVIGQEFENVIVILGEDFYYDGNKLKDRKMSGIPYRTGKMFFQQITRAVNKLEIVVVNNFDVFNKLIDILN